MLSDDSWIYIHPHTSAYPYIYMIVVGLQAHPSEGKMEHKLKFCLKMIRLLTFEGIGYSG